MDAWTMFVLLNVWFTSTVVILQIASYWLIKIFDKPFHSWLLGILYLVMGIGQAFVLAPNVWATLPILSLGMIWLVTDIIKHGADGRGLFEHSKDCDMKGEKRNAVT